MRTSLFSFDLPDELIAQSPPEQRGLSRLMVMPRNPGAGELVHSKVGSLPEFLDPGTLIIFNDTRVRKARMFARSEETGGKGEFLFLAPVPEGWSCLVDKARKRKIGQRWLFPGGITGTIIDAPDAERRILRLEPHPDEGWFEACGHVPLPPYMRREDKPEDSDRYQTVYAREIGSAAAPTAGLHFTEDLLAALADAGMETGWITLEVGLGTFAPVRSETLAGHAMHTERYTVPRETADRYDKARREGRRILAVGTTSVRTLESAWTEKGLRPGAGKSDLFIHPGYRFRAADAIFTNFHTPRSSLIMLVSAFCGRERLLAAYRMAVTEGYRFFSYGDAMLIR